MRSAARSQPGARQLAGADAPRVGSLEDSAGIADVPAARRGGEVDNELAFVGAQASEWTQGRPAGRAFGCLLQITQQVFLRAVLLVGSGPRADHPVNVRGAGDNGAPVGHLGAIGPRGGWQPLSACGRSSGAGAVAQGGTEAGCRSLLPTPPI